MVAQRIHHQICFTELDKGKRLDHVLCQYFPSVSRERVKTWIRTYGVLTASTFYQRPSMRVKHAERARLITDELLVQKVETPAQQIEFGIVYEDKFLLVVNKPAGLVVHPGAGVPDQTLLNGLLYYYPDLSHLPRGGIIHRLDKGTSGLLLVAKTESVQYLLSTALAHREIERIYAACVLGVCHMGGTVNRPIGRHAVHRTKMSIRENGRPAVTHYQVVEQFKGATLLSIRLETGRTHQIRVHCASIGHPLLGDYGYGAYRFPHSTTCTSLKSDPAQFDRPALHAAKLCFKHPETGKKLTIETPLPEDMYALILQLRSISSAEFAESKETQLVGLTGFEPATPDTP